MSNQLPLFAHPMARKSDPDSSHAAADKLENSGKAQRQRDEVLAHLKRWPGATSKELAERMDTDRYMTARRLPELERENLAYSTRVKGQQVRWYAKEKA